MSLPELPIRQRTPAERVAYVEGFAAGWKEAIKDCQTDFEAESLANLDHVLDLMSAVENDLRARESVR